MKSKILSILLVMLLAISAVALVSCDSPIELDKPANVRYDGATITWNPVENANSYTVAINDGEAYPVTTNRFPYAAKGQSFSVKITAVSNAEKIVSSGETTMMFFPLEAITELNIASDGTISWAAVENATAYEINVDNVVVDTVSTLSYSGLEAGTHSVKVRPVVQGDNSYYSSWSPAESMTVLSTVAKDDITYTNGNIRWKYVSGAQYYEVRVNGNVVAEKCTTTNIPYNAENLNFEVTVKALGNGSTTFDGAMSEEKAFIFLDTVTNVRVEDGILLWDEVAGADSYKLELNGIVQSNNFTVCEFTKLTAGVDTDVRVMPISNDTTYFSDWSTSKTVRILQAPHIQWNSSLELDGEANNNVYWDLVPNATGYAVKLVLPSGEEVITTWGETQKAFADSYYEAGTYTVQVKALAPKTDSNLNDSAYSQPITITRLDAPERLDNNFITSNAEKVIDGFTVTFKAVSGASKYQLYQDNNPTLISETQQFHVGDLIAPGSIAEQTYNFKIQAVGSIDTVNNNVYVVLSSLTSRSLSFDIKVLAAPTDTSISGYTYSFGSVVGASGYAVDINGTAKATSDNSYSLETLEVGNYQISVCAKGNGADVLPSNYTGATTVYRLSAPTNVRIHTLTDEGCIDFDEIDGARSYEIIYDNSIEASEVKRMQNINGKIREEGTTVCLRAVANYYNNTETVYYMTSPRSATATFIKLAVPTFGDKAFTDDQLVWKAPDNINTSIYTPTYEVYDDRNTKINGDFNGTTMDISFLEGGESYTFYIKAIGDGTRYVNSGASTRVTIYKLATPTVTRADGKYQWEPVAMASEYAVFIDGVYQETFTNYYENGVYSFVPKFTEIKQYRVEVIAYGDTGYSTISSEPALIIQNTKQLETPDFELTYNLDEFSTSGEVTATITKESPYANGYVYRIGGATIWEGAAEVPVDALSYSIKSSTPMEYKASVYALGGNFDEEGNYYITSRSVGNNSQSQYNIILLGITNASGITHHGNGFIDWNGTDDAPRGYNVKVSINGGDPILYTADKAKINIDVTEEVYSIQIWIQARGNDGNIIASAWVESQVWYF